MLLNSFWVRHIFLAEGEALCLLLKGFSMVQVIQVRSAGPTSFVQGHACGDTGGPVIPLRWRGLSSTWVMLGNLFSVPHNLKMNADSSVQALPLFCRMRWLQVVVSESLN